MAELREWCRVTAAAGSLERGAGQSVDAIFVFGSLVRDADFLVGCSDVDLCMCMNAAVDDVKIEDLWQRLLVTTRALEERLTRSDWRVRSVDLVVFHHCDLVAAANHATDFWNPPSHRFLGPLAVDFAANSVCLWSRTPQSALLLRDCVRAMPHVEFLNSMQSRLDSVALQLRDAQFPKERLVMTFGELLRAAYLRLQGSEAELTKRSTWLFLQRTLLDVAGDEATAWRDCCEFIKRTYVLYMQGTHVGMMPRSLAMDWEHLRAQILRSAEFVMHRVSQLSSTVV